MTTAGASGPVGELDRGLLLGDALFETVPLYGGIPFRPRAHLDRLRTGAARVGIPVPPSLEHRFDAAIERWRGESTGVGPRAGRETPQPDARSFAGPDAALRVTLTRGPGWGLAPPEAPRPALHVDVRALNNREYPASGLSAVLRGAIHEGAVTAGIKAVGFLERIQALREARAAGAAEALVVNASGRVVEGTASNLFWVRAGTLHSPGPAAGALPGVTRAVVLDLAHEQAMGTGEDAPLPDELARADEIFLTSSLRELVPVTTLEGRRVGEGIPGPVFRGLALAFRSVVAAETTARPH